MTQNIRLSQFVITYGPGAILEGEKGPRVIPLPNIGLFNVNKNLEPEFFEISDQRITQGILEGSRIFRLPSNAELGRSEDYYLYRTKPFPTWKLCLNNYHHKGNFSVLYSGNYCPVCKSKGMNRTEAIRFITACPDGHMNDVSWKYIVHENNKQECHHKEWFKWYGGGGSLSGVEIICPKCNSKANLGKIYGRTWKCSGRYPERELLDEMPNFHECNKEARIIQRQASNLRIPELITLFSVPPRYTKLHNLLQMRDIYNALIVGEPESKKDLENIINKLVRNNLLSSSSADEILSYSWEELKRAIDDVLTPVGNSYHDLITEEFHALIDASYNGVPPVNGPQPKSPVIFEVDPNMTVKCSAPGGTKFRVTPVRRLRTVTVNKGYRREIGSDFKSKPVPIGFSDSVNTSWYPGVEFLGEGLFIMQEESDGTDSELSGKATDEWLKVYSDPSYYPEYVFRDPDIKEELHPLFVRWHTLSHLLIRSIAIEAGYSAASIRERIYIEHDESKNRGGILLYASQPGTDGTLGGLIALAPNFQDIFDIAFEQLQTCSGDPLCRNSKFQAGVYNGAACYNCLLLSETSCEHRNMWLDRNVLMENMP